MLSLTETQALTAAFEAVLRAIDDPAGGEALWAAHAASAVLVVGDRACRKDAVSPADFAAAHQAASEGGGAPRPVYGAVTLTETLPAAPGAACARFAVTLEDGTSMPVLAGFLQEDDAWRLEWAVAAPAPTLTAALGAATMLTHFPLLGRSEFGSPRHWLDLAIAAERLIASAPPMQYLEDARFSCAGLTPCCTYNWSVTLPAEAQHFIDAVPWAEVAPEMADKPQLPVLPSGELQLRQRDEACRFLDPAGRCRLHAQFGTPVFTACTTFPISFAATPEGVDVSASYFCGSVRSRLGQPIAAREADLRKRLVQGGARRTEAYHMTPGVEVPWEVFKDAETVLLQVLKLDHVPLRRRLWMGARVLDAWLTGGPRSFLAWEREILEPLDEIEEAFAATLLSVVFDGAAVSLPELTPGQAFTLTDGEVSDPATVVGWFENVLFSKELSYAFDLGTAFNMLIVLYLIVIQLEQTYGGPLPERVWLSVTGFVNHGGLAFMLKALYDEVPDLKEPLGQPTYGMVFLRCGAQS